MSPAVIVIPPAVEVTPPAVATIPPVVAVIVLLLVSVLMTLLLGMLVYGRRVTRAQWLSMAFAYAGIVLVFQHDVALGGARATVCVAGVRADGRKSRCAQSRSTCCKCKRYVRACS